ncbi:Ku protein [Streptomyces sp. NPDC016566]|uniref:non-homologous end joining protein Ku n=1 Tax=Streptomyces sp. NPDC016566 TaxID=3364967 RepID=UPI0037003B92
MQSVWAGAISFGLVTVPIAMVAATEDRSVCFRRIHLADNGLVRNRYLCEQEDREVSYSEIGRGYEMADGRVIPVTDADLRSLPLPTARAIEIHGFVPMAAVDPLRIGPGYYLRPEGDVAIRAYVLLQRALARSSRVAVAKLAWHGRERLALLRVRGDVIVLHAMLLPDEVRDPSTLAPAPAAVSEEELEEADRLVEALSVDTLEGEEFRDHFREAVEAVVEAKREHLQLPEAPQPARPARVVDLMAALRESVDKAKASRGQT